MSQSFNDEDIFVKNIPVPSELPKSPELTGVPEHIVRSGAVDTLIRQNDDLMARLNVSLRRISALEEKITSYEKLNEKIKTHYNNLKDEVSILREKDSFVSKRHQQLESELKDKSSQLKNLETDYARIYSEGKDQKETLVRQLQSMQRRLLRYIRYRKKIQRAQKFVKSQHNESLQNIKSKYFELEKKLIQIETNSIEQKKSWNQELHQQKQSIEQLQAEKKQLVEQHEDERRTIYQRHNSEVEQLVQKHDNDLQQHKSKIQSLSEEILSLKEKTNKYDALHEEHVQLQNRKVFDDRRHQEQNEDRAQEIEKLKSSLSHYRLQARNFEDKHTSSSERLQQLESENKKYGNDCSLLTEQVENLQTLWKDAQRDLEKQLEKNKSLQKLNQNLSVSMNQTRKDMQDLQLKLERTQVGTTHFKSSVPRSIDQTIEVARHHTVSEPVQEPRHSEDMSKRIDSILAEVQAGFIEKP